MARQAWLRDKVATPLAGYGVNWPRSLYSTNDLTRQSSFTRNTEIDFLRRRNL